MHDAALVGGVHGAGQGFDQRGGVARRQRGAVELLRQAAAVDVFQREVRQAFVLADFVDLHDVRVLQARDGFGFGAESSPLVRRGVLAGQDHLQGDDAVERDLPGLVDDAHAAAAELAEDFVAGDIYTGNGVGSRRRFQRACRPVLRYRGSQPVQLSIRCRTSSNSSGQSAHNSSGVIDFPSARRFSHRDNNVRSCDWSVMASKLTIEVTGLRKNDGCDYPTFNAKFKRIARAGGRRSLANKNEPPSPKRGSLTAKPRRWDRRAHCEADYIRCFGQCFGPELATAPEPKTVWSS